MSARVAPVLIGAVVFVGSLALARPLNAQAPAPPPMAAAELDERVGAELPLEATFTNSSGEQVSLARYFDGARPVLLTLAYSRCPMLCDLVLRGAIEAMPRLELALGKDFRALTLLIDPDETLETASEKQATLLRRLGRDDAPEAWPFLIGSAAAIRRVADAIGFGYMKDERTGQYAHPAVLMLLTPDGRVSSYLHGIRFPSDTLRAGLIQAAQGRQVANRSLGEAVMRCFRFDPALRRYGPRIAAMFRWGGGALFLVMVLVLGWLFRWERRRR